MYSAICHTYSMQIVLPLGVFFALAGPIFGLRLPLYASKHFLVLLPSLFVLLATGVGRIRELSPRIGGLIVTGLCVALFGASAIAAQRYWTTSKSPEEEAARQASRQLQPDDAIVSLHYGLDAAISFYLPHAASYTSPQQIGDQICVRSLYIHCADPTTVDQARDLSLRRSESTREYGCFRVVRRRPAYQTR